MLIIFGALITKILDITMGTHYQGTPQEISVLNSFIKMVRAYESLSSQIYLKLEREGLTESQFFLLDAIYHLGPLNQKVLSTKISCSEGNMTMVVNNLEKRGLIKKKQSQDDRRIYIIKLKKKGRKLYEKVFPKFLKTLTADFVGITEREHEYFQKISKKIGKKSED